MTAAQLALFARLKLWRTAAAAKLALDPALFWPMVSLQRLARDPGSFDSELSEPNIRRWQRTEFAADLQKVLPAKA
jgi:hypothetical protein